jgi:hypothetical protein
MMWTDQAVRFREGMPPSEGNRPGRDGCGCSQAPMTSRLALSWTSILPVGRLTWTVQVSSVGKAVFSIRLAPNPAS